MKSLKFYFLLFLYHYASSKYHSHETELRKSLLADYDLNVRPSESTDVSLHFTLIHYDMNEEIESIDMELWMHTRWNDPRLKWNFTENQISQLAIPQNSVWKPDLTIYTNAHPDNFNQFSHVNTIVTSDGEVQWIPPVHIKSKCIIDMTYWPYDTHNCTVNIGSWVHKANYINLTLNQKNIVTIEDTIVEQENTQLTRRGEWKILNSKAVRTINKYPCCPLDDYVKIQLTLMLKRESPAFRWYIQMPCTVLALLTVAIFLLPPSAGEKVIFGGMVLMMDLIFLLATSQIIGHSPSHTPIIVKFISQQLILTCTSVIISCFIFSMTRYEQTISLPRFVIRPIEYLARFLWLYPTRISENPVSFSSVRKEDSLELDEDMKLGNFQIKRDWLILAIVFDRICLLLFFGIFIISVIANCNIL